MLDRVRSWARWPLMFFCAVGRRGEQEIFEENGMSFTVLLPFRASGVRVSQWNGDFNDSDGSHNTSSITSAYDFALVVGTQVLAVAAGKVVSVRENVPNGTT